MKPNMSNDECKHKGWRLVKTGKVQGFKIWECERCQFKLKEKITGSHEVFVVKDLSNETVGNKTFPYE
jgi:hypothetical protein